ncbi:RNA polymerase primary sigma factor/RNA polymerase sporulation-specific sigma factor [Clostridium tetanomorphum]|uniref:sigma-70 family RNA polymerase sigma factor n=1 Tax=Clostridium tetanomorphum TaxID=1553 RepID=UPI00044DD049|nr:sigma-70 family RNA polymerase sigma factor [Clostridium tetanomorphum]KAJ49717.1 RNA polymerase sigma factor-like protein [Clostridium tetanomorphum DSM 665]MBP1866578.1 RNA polymerase primary sigma factor/RNA polymerase sporulation-specific sigma factor [Clostridium tetanomorphum]NRS86642.1 RNA polymerase primary sigma factor/RNA polymerase sporulation-specific sigma factor [Clostridium tetanomorphum]SQC01758.1 RNA polymerase sigma factor-like protein [Clostridium tetanomorphum]
MTNEELVHLYQNGDGQALSKLIEQNTGIVYKLVNKFYIEGTNSIDKEDLEQEGFIGLIIAANKYDFNNPKKANFITYAIHWIYSKISRFINQKNTNEETSLNIPIGEDEENELLDTIKDIDYSYENVEEKIYIQQLRQELEELMLQHNTLRQREILKLHYGWNNSKPMNLREIGEVLNMPYRHVRCEKFKALRKIRWTPWGRNKAKEIYVKKVYDAKYDINANLEFMDWKDKYIC